MPLTKSFKETVKARMDADPEFRKLLFIEAMQELVSGDSAVGRTLLRNYINASCGFESLSKAIDTPKKSLMRMLGPKGNPNASNLFTLTNHLQEREGLKLMVVAAPAKKKKKFAKKKRATARN